MPLKWSIAKISKSCRKCGMEFQDGIEVYSSIKMAKNDDETVDTERFDFCLSCWEKVNNGSDPFWKCVYRKPEKEDGEKEIFDKDLVMRKFLEFNKICEENDSEENKDLEIMIYLLALLLERKKRLIVQNTSSLTNGDYVYYKDSKSSDIFKVKIPEITDDDISYYQEKLKEVLPDKKKTSVENTSASSD